MWKEGRDDLDTGSSCELSLSDVKGQARKLRKETKVLKEYDSVITGQLASGVIQRVEESQKADIVHCSSSALIGYSISEYPAPFTDSPPVPPSERRQTRVSCEQNAFPVCCRNKLRNFTTNQASYSQNT